MLTRLELLKYLNSYLNIKSIKDSALNGLQVEGTDKIFKICFGVSASLELFKKAKEKGCDTIIVHHGIFWGKVQPIKSYFKNRLEFLLVNKLNLVAYHLPLDKHEILGNNISLINLFKVKNITSFGIYNGKEIGYSATLNLKSSFKNIEKVLIQKLKCKTVSYNTNKPIKSIAIVSGGASEHIYEAIDQNIDLFITGENAEYMKELCRESKTSFIALGHYSSEKLGIINLQKHLELTFNVKTIFIDIPNLA